jgi:hypothetical protein
MSIGKLNSTGFQRNSNSMAALPAQQHENLFAVVSVDQVALAKSAAGQHLDSINSAGIVVHNRYHLLVLGLAFPQPGKPGLGGPVTYRKTRTDMSMKIRALSEVFISQDVIGRHHQTPLRAKDRGQLKSSFHFNLLINVHSRTFGFIVREGSANVNFYPASAPVYLPRGRGAGLKRILRAALKKNSARPDFKSGERLQKFEFYIRSSNQCPRECQAFLII